MVFDGSGAICRLGGYERAIIVDKIRTPDDEMNGLNSRSRSCCAEVSFRMGNSDSDSGGDIHVKRIVISHIVGGNTHL